jgi:gliding motility-associated-like protein
MRLFLLFAAFFGPCAMLVAQGPPCDPVGRNLVINPGFELGYYGFTSDFGRGLNNATRCNCNTQGWILVCNIFPHASFDCQYYPAALSAQYGAPNTATSPDPAHPSNTSVVNTSICNVPLPDHTSGQGYFLSVDPDDCPGRSYWKQSLRVCPNTNYYFSAWVQNIGGQPAPTFHFEAGGVPVTDPRVFSANTWEEVSSIWNSGNLDGVVSLELVNDLPGCIANDVAIDDVYFGVCAAVLRSSDTVFRFCPDAVGTLVQLSAHAEGFQMPEYQWEHWIENGWAAVPGATDTLLTLESPGLAEAGRYRLAAAEKGNLDAATCTVYSPEFWLRPYPSYHFVDSVQICQGQTYAGYTAGGSYTRAYATTEGCDSVYTLHLRVRETLHVYVANVFRPDDDGRNDRLAPDLSDPFTDHYTWKIFDRWGNLVFESYTPGQAWDGRSRGKDCLSGIYAYFLEVEINGCDRVRRYGDVLLLR